MNASHMRSRWRSRALAFAAGVHGAACCIVAAGCADEPFVRDNPFDPGSPLNAQLVGAPDTILSLQETLTVMLVTDPPLPPESRLIWSSSPTMEAIGEGMFRQKSASINPSMVVVHADVGPTVNPRRISVAVPVRQRPAYLDFDCDSPCVFNAIKQNHPLRINTRDALGSLVAGYSALRVGDSLSIRDTSVLRLVEPAGVYGAVVSPRKNGQTWVVARRGDNANLKDSVLVVVAQEAWRVQDCTIWMEPDEWTAQIPIFPVLDRYGEAIPQPWPRVLWTPGHPFDDQPGVATVTEDGFITKIVREGIWVTEAHFEGDDRLMAVCTIYMP